MNVLKGTFAVVIWCDSINERRAFLLPVTNICKQFLIAKQKGDGVNTFTFPASVICRPEADAMVYRRRYDRWAEFTLYR